MNSDLIEHFTKLVGYYKILKESVYKTKTWELALSHLKTTPIRKGSDILAVKGLGKSVATEIDEVLTTGTSTRLEEIMLKCGEDPEMLKTLKLFEGIYCVGPATAKKFYEKGYRTLEDLRDADLTHAQNIGLELYDDFLLKIPRKEITTYEAKIKKLLPGVTVCLAGSYRRLAKESGDIDVLCCTNKSTQEIVKMLKPLIVATLSNGENKFLGVSQLTPEHPYRRMDICTFSREEWGTAILYNTGSAKFNVLMRSRAIELGLTLNEFELSGVQIDTEEDVFKALGVEYLAPEERVNDIKELPIINARAHQ